MNSSKPTIDGRYLARTLYDGSGGPARTNVLIEVKNGVFSRISSYQCSDTAQDIQEYDIMTPGLIDIQINGANDVQFNGDTSPVAVAKIAEGAAKGGTAWVLPTFVTSGGTDYLQAIKGVKDAIKAGTPGVLGVHLEGPFLSPKRPGIHPSTAIRPLSNADLANITKPFPGQLLVTLAPEEQPPGMVRKLTDAGVIVFAGHTEATAEDIDAAKSEGLQGVTHLFNAMSQLQGRAPGVVGSVLGGGLYAGIIADGYHVHWDNVALAVKTLPDHLCLVTDAMCTLAGTLTEFDFFDEHIFLNDGKLSNSQGTLAGAHIAMDESIRNLVNEGIAAPELAVKLASRNPAEALGIGDWLGSVKEGYKASLSAFNRSFSAITVFR